MSADVQLLRSMSGPIEGWPQALWEQWQNRLHACQHSIHSIESALAMLELPEGYIGKMLERHIIHRLSNRVPIAFLLRISLAKALEAREVLPEDPTGALDTAYQIAQQYAAGGAVERSEVTAVSDRVLAIANALDADSTFRWEASMAIWSLVNGIGCAMDGNTERPGAFWFKDTLMWAADTPPVDFTSMVVALADQVCNDDERSEGAHAA